MKAAQPNKAQRFRTAIESLENRLLLSYQVLSNPGFESGLSGWTAGSYAAGNSITAATDQARSGTHSLKLTAATSDSRMYINSDWFAVAPDGHLNADLWLRSSITSGSLKVTVNVYDAARSSQKSYIDLVNTGSSFNGWSHYERATLRVGGYSPSLLASGSAWAQYRISFTNSRGTVWIDDTSANYQALPTPNPSGLTAPAVLPNPWLMNRAGSSFALGSMGIVYNSAESNLHSATNSWAGTLGVTKAFFTNPADPNLGNYAFKLRYGSGSDSDINAAFQQRFPGHTWAELGNEGYFLSIQQQPAGGQVIILAGANSQQGRFYALQTLRQLTLGGKLHAADVLDKPSMEQRGIVMSAARYNQADTLDRMAAVKMNTSWSQGTFMNDKFKENWRTPFTQSELNNLKSFITKANANFITPWMAFGPRGSGEGARPHPGEPVYSSDTDINIIVDKMDQLYGIGVRHFGINYDDIQNYNETTLVGADAARWGTNGYAYAHAYFLSEIKQRLQTRHAETPLQFSTVAYDYWFPAAHGGSYLTPFAQNLPQDVTIITCSYTDADIQAMQNLTGRRTLVWHNYYAEAYNMTNSTYGAPFVAVYSWDDPAIRAEMSGIIALMMQPPEDTARTSWKTTADYQWAPDRYDPDLSFQLAAMQHTGVVPTPVEGNVVNNPGFEAGLNASTDWETFATGGGTVSRVTSDIHSGAYSLYSASSNTTGNTGAYTNWFTAPAGSTVTFTAWIKYADVTGAGPSAPTPSGIRMTLDAYMANKSTRVGWWNFVDFEIGSSNGWIKASGSAVMPASTIYARGRFQVDHCPGTLWVDDVEIKVATTPLAPANVQAGDGAATDRVPIAWSAVPGAEGYEVWRNISNDSASAVKITGDDVTTTSYDDFSAVAGTTYWYWVRAMNAAGTSPFSSSDSGYRAIPAKNWVGPASGGDWSAPANWSPAGVPAAGDIVTITGSIVSLAGSAMIQGLNLIGNATLALAASGGSVLRTAALSIDGNSKLDLNDNYFILDYSGATPQTTLGGYLAAGRGGGSWIGRGGIASSAAASDPTRALGYAEASDFAFSTFAGQNIDTTALLIRYTVGGDANLDGKVDVGDLGILASNWQQTPRRWSHADFNYDNTVNVADLGVLASSWQASLQSMSVRTGAASPAIRTSPPARAPFAGSDSIVTRGRRSLVEDVGLL